MSQCLALTKDNERCKNSAEHWSLFCRRHRWWWFFTLVALIITITTIGANIATMFDITFPYPFRTENASMPPSETSVVTPMINSTSTINSTETPLAVSDPDTPTPIKVYDRVASFILLDRSGSMMQDPLNESVSRQLVDTFLEIAPRDDLIGVGTYAEQTQIIVPLTTVREINLRPDLSEMGRVGTFDDLPLALNSIYEDFQSLPGVAGKRAIIITDSGILFSVTEQQLRFRQVIRQYREADIELDIIVLENDFPVESSGVIWLSEEDVNLIRMSPTRPSDIPNVAMNTFYAHHQNQPQEMQFVLTSSTMYQLVVPPKAQKFVFFLYSNEDNSSPSASAIMSLTTPTGEQFQKTLETDFSTFVQENPQAGTWIFKLSSPQRITLSVDCLILPSSNP